MELSSKESLIEHRDKLTASDHIYLDDRKRPLTVDQKRDNHSQSDGKPQQHIFLKGNGTTYVLTFWISSIRLYRWSEIREIEDKDYTSGIRVKTEAKSGQRIHTGKFILNSYCEDCELNKYYDSESEEYYCPFCEA